jgi:hypothetical protein
MEDTWMRIEVRQNRLQDALLKNQKLQESMNDFVNSMKELEERERVMKPVSADLNKARSVEWVYSKSNQSLARKYKWENVCYEI